MKIVNTARGTVLMTHGKVAANFFARGIGLLGRKGLEPGEGLIIIPNTSVHCFFMRFPIDVVFVSKQHQVVYIYHAMKPWRMSKPYIKAAHYTVEVEAGAAARTNTQVGDQLQWQDEVSGKNVKNQSKPSNSNPNPKVKSSR